MRPNNLPKTGATCRCYNCKVEGRLFYSCLEPPVYDSRRKILETRNREGKFFLTCQGCIDLLAFTENQGVLDEWWDYWNSQDFK